jgi:uncharacterized iron-regulated protein
MKKIYLLALLAFVSMAAIAQKPAYKIFKADGSEATYNDMLNAAADHDVTLFGELHNNPVCHWLQLELAQDLLAQGKDLVLGAEMFEADNQIVLDEYLNGDISARSYEGQARLWPNYETDYRPLIEFARENQLNFVASNIPRRYASMVAKDGFEALDSLHEDAYKWIAPLPMPYDPELPNYKRMTTMMGMHREPNPNMPKAQASKDATMAHFILKNLKQDQVFVHYNGTYHSNNYEGIVWYLKKYKPGTDVLTIATVEQSQIDKLNEKHLKLADFILVIPETMTKTY